MAETAPLYATRTQDELVCVCGHRGFLTTSRNEQPFTGMWESYRLEGFTGHTFIITDERDRPVSVLKQLQPVCPKCGRIGTINYA